MLKKSKNGSRGFTLVELLVALAIMGIVIVAIFDSFLNFHKSSIIQDRVSEIQQIGRVAIDTLDRDLRLAGMDPQTPPAGAKLEAITATSVRFSLDRFHDRLEDGSFNDAGDDPDGFINSGSDSDECITYEYVDTNNDGNLDLIRRTTYGSFNAGENCSNNLPLAVSSYPVAENVVNFQLNQTLFRYWDANGVEVVPGVGDPSTVRRIDIILSVGESKEDPDLTDLNIGVDLDGNPNNGLARRRMFSSSVYLRNMALK